MPPVRIQCAYMLHTKLFFLDYLLSNFSKGAILLVVIFLEEMQSTTNFHCLRNGTILLVRP